MSPSLVAKIDFWGGKVLAAVFLLAHLFFGNF